MPPVLFFLSDAELRTHCAEAFAALPPDSEPWHLLPRIAGQLFAEEQRRQGLTGHQRLQESVRRRRSVQ